MLTQEQLKAALHEALKAAQPPCGAFCVSGATAEDGRYICWHNSTGSRSTDCQVVHSSNMLGLSPSLLASRLAAWVSGLHRGEKIDLNEHPA